MSKRQIQKLSHEIQTIKATLSKESASYGFVGAFLAETILKKLPDLHLISIQDLSVKAAYEQFVDYDSTETLVIEIAIDPSKSKLIATVEDGNTWVEIYSINNVFSLGSTQIVKHLENIVEELQELF